ncbi:MSCRAMM family adhesin SdrC [Limnofasciculus baicalensis]|uniref:MSCRAMM family adhesin SdrC n=1 Tax=Limnofasciculus baicalensis BBK-W-15 TaxID=2699891 RepID=A0AAE3GXT3_9CYAN|nr:MSCRAMM family adhesin SdrC [Limnofasciculus baicalensis]MCP2732560.1 MSCRAMM family adhesin SdrC [Limnofasciculus baicalensis BBK-W-15]
MKLPYFMRNLRIMRLLFQPIFLISLALHGIVLMLPAPFDLEKPKPPKKEETVKITKLPATANSSAQVSPESSPKPTPESSLPERQSAFPQMPLARPVFEINDSPDTPRNQEVVNSHNSQTKKQKKFKQQNQSNKLRDSQDNSGESRDSQDNPGKSRDSQNTSDKSRDSQDNPDKSRDSQNNPGKSRDTNEGNNTPPQPVNFFEQFPRYPGAEKGSGGVLRSQFDKAAYIFNTANNLRDVALYFERELKKNPNFKGTKLLTTNESNFKLYEVSNATGTETKYLHLIVKDGKTAIYLESENYTMAKLIDAPTEDREYQTFISHLFAVIDLFKGKYNLKDFQPDTDLETLEEKGKFTDNNFYLKGARKTTSDSLVSNDQLLDTFNQYLTNNKLEPLLNDGNYGGGTVYKIKSGKYESYIVFVPTKDKKIVIIWSKDKPN